MNKSIRFLVFSDTHGSASLMRRIIERNVGHADGVIHLGDGCRDVDRFLANNQAFSFERVRGNCDYPSFSTGEEIPLLSLLSCGGRRVLLCHGHIEKVKYSDAGLLQAAVLHDADIVLHGHTHSPRCEMYAPEQSPTGRPLLIGCPGCSAGTYGNGQFGVLELFEKDTLFHLFQD